MGHWENNGATDEWYTPKYIFDALQVEFDLDVAHPEANKTFVPAANKICKNSLEAEWNGFVWLNPPFGGRNGIQPWLDKFFTHNDGVALTPDRTSCGWFQSAIKKCDAALIVDGKIKFVRPDGSLGRSPSTGTVLFASGENGIAALENAYKNDLGFIIYNKLK